MSQKYSLRRRKFIKTAGAGAAVASLPAFMIARPARSAKMTKILVGEAPFISKGPNMIALEKGYFKKVGLDVTFKYYFDGALMVAPLLAGELDIATLTVSAGFFNAVARGGDLTMFLDGGTESKKDRSYVVTVVNQKLYDEGIRSAQDLKKIDNLPVHISDKGSINQYALDHSYMAAGVDPRKLAINFGLAQPQAMQLMMKGGVNVSNFGYHFGFFLQKAKKGQIIDTAADTANGAIISCYTYSKNRMADTGRENYVRYAMAFLQGVKEFNAAAGTKPPPSDILDILSKLTVFKGEKGKGVIKAIQPHWAWTVPDAKPNGQTIATMQDHWVDYRGYVKTKAPIDRVVDTSIVEEAAIRLKKEKPFG